MTMFTFSGKELVQFWELRNFELVRYVANGLQPYDDLGCAVYPFPIQEKRRELVKKQLEFETLESNYHDFYYPNRTLFQKFEEMFDDIRYADDDSEKQEIARQFEKFSEIELEKLDEFSLWQNRLRQVWDAIISLEDDLDQNEKAWENYTLPADQEAARNQIDFLLGCFYLNEDVNIVARLYDLKLLPGKPSQGVSQKYNDKHKEIENRIRSIIESAYDEITLLYRDLTGINQSDPKLNLLLKKRVMENYKQNQDSFENIRPEYLDDSKLFLGTPPNVKRDFVGRLLQILIQNKIGDDLEKYKYRKIGVASLYKRYRMIRR